MTKYYKSWFYDLSIGQDIIILWILPKCNPKVMFAYNRKNKK